MEISGLTDAELLADWLANRREPAFHALVSRYAPLVHSAAKRIFQLKSFARFSGIDAHRDVAT